MDPQEKDLIKTISMIIIAPRRIIISLTPSFGGVEELEDEKPSSEEYLSLWFECESPVQRRW
jgi:hypothetical protein